MMKMKVSSVLRVALIAVCLLAMSVSVQCAVIYVKTDGSDSSNGLSWGTAKETVQAGLNAAASGDEVWVKAGTYVERITLKSGAALYGGFAGTETERVQRNWTTNKTILDGNQGGSVVTSPSGAAQTTRIDGFTIRNASASNGGGIYCTSSSPTITNNTITGNSAYFGAGIYCTSSSPAITNNTIAGNSASDSGGGIYCAFSSSPTIANNTITGNSASDFGGGGIYCSYSSPAITNNTITGNSTSRDGGGICFAGSSPTIVNNIVAFNSSGIYGWGESPTLRNNCVYNPGGYNYSGIEAGTSDIQVDPKLCASEYGEVHIQPDSPCVNAGNDSVIEPGWLDMDGQARIQGSQVDIGADESDGTVWAVRVIRVKPEGNDSNDGSSWELAKRSVQAGIDAAQAAGGGEIWVAAGTYVERITLKYGAALYGGFAGSETERAERDWSSNATILDGNAGGSVVTARYIPGYGTSTIDGFTIRNGEAYSGGGIYCYDSSPTLANNTITGNSATDGGGIYCRFSSPTITNNTITENSAGWYGGGIYCESSSPTITNNTITGNSATRDGGGIYCRFSSPTIANNTITGNSAIYAGGGICCVEFSSMIANNIVAFNTSGIYGSGGSPTLRNNCVYNPGGYNYSGIEAGSGDIQVDPLFVDASSDNYRLSIGSPCIGSGDNSVVQPGWTDLDGNPRIFPTGGVVDMGCYEMRAPMPIGGARRLPAGSPVFVAEAVVTATNLGSGFVFIESADRSSGIKLVTEEPLSLGQRLSFQGTVSRVDGEYQIGSVVFDDITEGSPLSPVFVNTAAIGNDVRETLDYVGLNITGLLVRTVGKVTGTITAQRLIYVDDGYGYQDGVVSDPVRGIRVHVPSGVAIPSTGEIVIITGIVRVEKITLDNGGCVNGELYPPGTVVYVPSLWARDADDVLNLP